MLALKVFWMKYITIIPESIKSSSLLNIDYITFYIISVLVIICYDILASYSRRLKKLNFKAKVKRNVNKNYYTLLKYLITYFMIIVYYYYFILILLQLIDKYYVLNFVLLVTIELTYCNIVFINGIRALLFLGNVS